VGKLFELKLKLIYLLLIVWIAKITRLGVHLGVVLNKWKTLLGDRENKKQNALLRKLKNKAL
jgi:hypothetical protein